MTNYYIKAQKPQRSTATILKTNQTTSYRSGDDGDIQAGRDVDFMTLSENNPFGTTDRFTGVAGLSITNSIIIDWSTYNGSTVLGYYTGGVGTNRTWNNAIDWAVGLNIAGFTNWRLINVNELFNIFRNGQSMGFLNYAPFNIGSINIWTSTTEATSTSSAIFRGTGGSLSTTGKSNSHRTIACRDFTVIGTTLT